MRSCRLPTDGICPLPDGRSVRLPQDRRRRGGDKTTRRKQRRTGNTKQTVKTESHVPNRIERRGAKLFGDDFRRGFRSDAFRFALIALFTAAVRLFIGSLSGSVVTYLLFGVYLTPVLPVAVCARSRPIPPRRRPTDATAPRVTETARTRKTPRARKTIRGRSAATDPTGVLAAYTTVLAAYTTALFTPPRHKNPRCLTKSNGGNGFSESLCRF